MLRSTYLLVLFIGSSLALAGCANVSAIPVGPGSNVRGIRIYDIKPLLVVSGENVSVVMVPNYNRAYALRFSSFLAKHDFEADFQNGFITKVKSNQDTTAFPIALVNLIQEAVKTGNPVGQAFSAKGGGTGNRFGVYDIVFDQDGNLVGLRRLISDSSLIRVPNASPAVIPPPPPGSETDIN
jgi:hypothetical protein